MAKGFVRIVRIRRAEIPKGILNTADFKKMGKTVEAGILKNIRTQKQATGAPIKRNAQSTIDRKRAKGRRIMSLVDRLHRFVKGGGASWRTKATRKGATIEPATSELRNLSRWVQQKGYTGWFDVSKEARAAMRAIMRKAIKREFAKKRSAARG